MYVLSRRFAALALLLALMIPALAACGGAATTSPTTAPVAVATDAPAATAPAAPEAPTEAMAATEASTEAPTEAAMTDELSGQLTIAGSSALLPLIQEAANQFQTKNPKVQITVTAGGSGAGRTQVCEGKIDIGNSDVPISDDEKTKLNCADAEMTPVAIQAFAPVANKEGPGSVTSLTKDQIVGIFSGTITNWKDVGGDDMEIILVNRAKGSGTRANMAKFLFAGDDTQFATGASEEDNNETVKTTVAQTPGAISYLGFAYLSDPDLLAFSIDGVAPTKADIQAGKWPIGGPGYAITKGAPSELAKAFLDYVTSAEFQGSDVFDKLGFVPVGGASASSGDTMAMADLSGQLTIAGSSALLPLIQEAANQFQTKNPKVQITVTAGGSGAGRTQVCEGKIDIGNSDVPISDDEKTKLNCADAEMTPVAIQAFAPVANKKGPGSVTSLTKDQIVGIFNGTITNWKDVGGDDTEIILVNRAKGSGTRANMAKFLFAGDDTKFATGASEEDNNETVKTTVAQTPGAISYLGFAYLNDPDLLAFSIDGVAPTKADIQAGKWQIGGPGYAITKGAPSELAQAFLDYVTSAEFQGSDAFDKLGFVPAK
ncbi:phosphate ABC transporter substrate-binding protein [Chloroflexales bacterium ZM16-3]|nr:phosphate ABC transporter substrate-binding protein [Chloroflexales bacterium ZM16-3]